MEVQVAAGMAGEALQQTLRHLVGHTLNMDVVEEVASTTIQII
jgi:predicted Zn-dependent protease